VLTTPDADAVAPDTAWPTLFPVLSVGLHEFLVNADGFERLLKEAGFHAKVWNVGPSLRAVAAHHPGPLASVRPDAQAATIDLIRYCDARAVDAAPGSALALGMATRHLKWAMRENLLDVATTGLPALRGALIDRYKIDIDDPEPVIGRSDVPAVLTIIFFNLGLLRMWHQRSPERAAACFAAAASAGAAQFERHGLYPDPETPTVEALARGHLALAFARCAPEKVDGILAELEQGIERGAGNAALVAELRAHVDAELAVQRSPVKRTYRRARAIAGTAKRRLQSGFLAR
jgi:hypothetical protein